MTGFWQITWLIPPGLLLGALAASAFVSALLSILVMKGGPVDLPRERGAHSDPTPTSGGLAIMAASALVIGLTISFYGHAIPGSWRDGLILFGFASLMGICGAVDDVADLPASWRLAFQIGLCLVFAYFYRVTALDFGPGVIVQVPPVIGLLGSATWLILTLNTINFMDGSNGLAIGAQTIAMLVFAGLILLMAPLSLFGAYLGVVLLICVCVAGAHLGFAPFNLPPGKPQKAKAFQGDAGSMFAGALIGGATLVVKAYGVGSVWFGGFLLAPLLVDVVLTLIVRTRKGQNVLKPHKEHLYQIWLQRRDSSHWRLALRVWALCLFSSLVGVGARLIDRIYHTDIRFLVLVALIAVYTVGWLVLRKQLLMRPLLNKAP
ncbi:glycosyltransferase family 4 protein [Asticcacaulis taihuensis]|uniref:UDP-N-acetylmuramyl pentapeptide phosphotransferase/UDP-N-acetylglucosamine-1-phosphate transferase n=1 Tax=Asticcacaulis taihuensis TaxID=260084 RepID=A0A1G4QFV9_9CAUL|nr:glycosyl transferase family 4 family protein [Asticcacaulis taihuensis]SCW43321.1 UDP-N-acetylmuramyl pentapeptide phosphotransferase/UDP-N-acetylglucosamine-1-phosphate transferase [Asticcacaulis taihuensis]